jgi:hypothetical protein
MRRRETRRRRRRIQLMYRRRFTDSLPPFSEAASGNPSASRTRQRPLPPGRDSGCPGQQRLRGRHRRTRSLGTASTRRTGRKVALEPGERARLRGSRFVA